LTIVCDDDDCDDDDCVLVIVLELLLDELFVCFVAWTIGGTTTGTTTTQVTVFTVRMKLPDEEDEILVTTSRV